MGVHVVGWTDTFTAIGQILERRAMGEIGMRVAMAMSDKDSNDLLDTPAASKLGPHRALYFDEEQIGTFEKFRPYGRPPREWLMEVGRRLRART
jgi:hypothetical protein